MAATIVLAHGAAGTAASMQPYVNALRRHGLVAEAIDLPKHGRTPVKAERAVPVFLDAVGDRVVVGGGHSYGGRVASLAAAQAPGRFAALVLLSYPLHRPGHPEGGLRTEHWPAIRCPVLFLTGDRDPFARIDMLRRAVAGMPKMELVVYPGLGHGLVPVAEEAMDRVSRFLRGAELTL